MKIRYYIFLTMAAVVALMSSCLSDDTTEVTYYNDAAVKTFSVSAVKRTLHSKTKNGKDTVITTSLTPTTYKFTIDQEQGLIYNVDSLPSGVNAAKCLVSVSTVNGGYAYLKSLTSDTITAITTTDSLDFSQPRTLRVVANDFSWHRDYTVTVNVHNEKEDSVYWSNRGTNSSLAALEDMHAISFNDKVIVYGTTAGAAKVYATAATDGSSWTEQQTPFASVVTMAANSKFVYALSAGSVYASHDGAQWTAMSANTALQTLVAASSTELYAISNDGKMMLSEDNGATWAEDKMDSSSEYLPKKNISAYAYTTKTNDDLEKVVMVGYRDNDTDESAMVWSKVVDTTSKACTQPWSYHKLEKNNHTAPVCDAMNVVRYNGGALMITDNSGVLFSKDDGLNWLADSRFDLPAEILNPAAVTVDGNNRFWVICKGTGQVWNAYLSQLTW